MCVHNRKVYTIDRYVASKTCMHKHTIFIAHLQSAALLHCLAGQDNCSNHMSPEIRDGAGLSGLRF